jgi:heat-inducible transcriptional repressor
MNSRQELILGSVVEEYVDSAVPVSSSLLAGKYGFNLSPATIRAEMMELESENYLYQPHTSAGRIPTDKGFRYFVDVLMEERELSKKEKRSLRVEILKLRAQNEMLARTAAKLLSNMSGSLAVSGFINSDNFYKYGVQKLLSQPEFSNSDSVCKIAEVIDYLDESVSKLSKELKSESEVEIYIGKENPINGADECGMVVSKYNLRNGKEGLLVIVGPKRMKYSRNVSLIDYLKKLLGRS